MNKQYVGVTIGPITDTLMLTSSPAGLWGASYLFSWISRRLIHYLVVDYKVEQSRFVAPFFSVKNNEIFLPEENDIDYENKKKKGIGLFHDRIIFCSDSLTNPLEIVAKAREAVICELTEEIARIESKMHSPTVKNLIQILGPLGYTIKIEKIKKQITVLRLLYETQDIENILKNIDIDLQ